MITVEAGDLHKTAKALAHIKGATPKALALAMNRAIKKGRTELSKETRKIYTIKQKDLYSTLTLQNASGGSLGAEIRSRYSGMLKLYDFKVAPRGVQRRGRRPVTATVRVGGGGTMAGGFVARMPTGHLGVFIRSSGSRMPSKPWKESINELHTISAPIMVSQPEVEGPTQEAIQAEFSKRLDHEIKRVLKGAG